MTDRKNKLENILNEPLIKPKSENFFRIRRNLLAISSFAIFYKHFNIKITKLTFLGNEFNIDNVKSIEIAISIIIFYQLIHFIFELLEDIYYWRLRFTGTKLHHVTTGKFSSQDGDYPDDPQQSTLYSWWSESNKQMKSFKNLNESLELSESFNTIKSLLQKENPNNIIPEINKLKSNILSIEKDVKTILNVITSERIQVSLERFDKWFWKLQKIQIIKYTTIEISFPILMAIYSLYSLLPSILGSFIRFLFG